MVSDICIAVEIAPSIIRILNGNASIAKGVEVGSGVVAEIESSAIRIRNQTHSRSCNSRRRNRNYHQSSERYSHKKNGSKAIIGEIVIEITKVAAIVSSTIRIKNGTSPLVEVAEVVDVTAVGVIDPNFIRIQNGNKPITSQIIETNSVTISIKP